MKYKKCQRKQSCPALKYSSNIRGKHKIHENSSTRLASLQAENSRLNLNNMKQNYNQSTEKEFNRRSTGLPMCLKIMAEFIRHILV